MDLSRGTAAQDTSFAPVPHEEPREVPWVTGCAMLLRRTVLEQIHGFDDRYYLNWEDVDLSLRVQGCGNSILLVPRARLFHKVGRSFAGRSAMSCYYYVRNNLLLVRTHSGRAYRVATLAVLFARVQD